MTLGQFKEKIEELEKAGLITDDFDLEVEDTFAIYMITSIEVNNEFIRLIVN